MRYYGNKNYHVIKTSIFQSDNIFLTHPAMWTPNRGCSTKIKMYHRQRTHYIWSLFVWSRTCTPLLLPDIFGWSSRYTPSQCCHYCHVIAACQSPRLAATGSDVMAVLDTPDDASGFVLHNEDSIQSPQAKVIHSRHFKYQLSFIFHLCIYPNMWFVIMNWSGSAQINISVIQRSHNTLKKRLLIAVTERIWIWDILKHCC